MADALRVGAADGLAAPGAAVTISATFIGRVTVELHLKLTVAALGASPFFGIVEAVTATTVRVRPGTRPHRSTSRGRRSTPRRWWST